MYLMIFEDGEIKSAKEISSDETQGADDGLLDLVNISNPENPTRWWDGEWQPIDQADD